MSLETFLVGLGSRLAQSLAGDLVKGLGIRAARGFGEPVVDQALKTALGEAMNATLPHALPKETPDTEELREHFKGLLEDFLKSRDVLAELTLLLDPRPGTLPNAKRVVDSFATTYAAADFPEMDLEAFLWRFFDAAYKAIGSQPALQKVVEIRLLGELLSSAREGVDVQRRIVDELAGTRRAFADGFRQMIDDGNDRPVVDTVNVFLASGWLDAYSGYEALLAELRGQGYEIDVGTGDRLEIEAPAYSELPRLPAAGVDTLRRLAGELRQAVLTHPLGDDELVAMDQRYRRRLDAWLSHLEFRGMMRAPRPIRLPLDQVYVELRAVAEVPEAADAFSVDERRLLLELEEEQDRRGDEQRRDLLDQLDALRRERWSRTLPERKAIADALLRGGQHACVVLGDPGSGKTTLLHFLTRVYARGVAAERLGVPRAETDRLPIFVPLAAFDDMRQKQPELTLRDFLALYYDTRRGLPGLAPLFQRAFEKGRALVLFDGLDEVLDVGTRRFVADQVAALIHEWTPRGVRFVLASRVVGYRDAPVSGVTSTLTVLDFGSREIEVFV
ncbi:MAG: NACHT domain-containing protein, partial [bacterium]|nr:NACHT domain-containing protein [bacterium]